MACNIRGRDECSYKSLVGKPERKRPLGRPDIDGTIILMVLKDVACLFKGWIGSGGSLCEHIKLHFVIILITISLSKSSVLHGFSKYQNISLEIKKIDT
jgi:hypothetical protein